VLDASCKLITGHLSFLAGGHETLELSKPASVTGTITGFGQATHNTIDLLGARVTGLHYTEQSSSSGMLTVAGTAGSTLHFSRGNYHASQFHFAIVGGSTHITFV
jgi:hypothetical protein